MLNLLAFPPESAGHYDKTALRFLGQLKRRLADFGDGLADVHGRLLWAEGILYARLGKRRTAMKRLESARESLLKQGLGREAAAVLLGRGPRMKPYGGSCGASVAVNVSNSSRISAASS